jgi:spore coat protein A, manganese oxidase
MITRRQFLRTAAMTGAGGIVTWKLGLRDAFAFYQSSGLKKFAQPLRGVGPGGIPVAAPDAFRASVTGATHYSLDIAEFEDQLIPTPGLTKLWGYNPAMPLGGGTQPQRHLGGIIVAQRGMPIQITFTNKLPAKHILPVDTTGVGPILRTGVSARN